MLLSLEVAVIFVLVDGCLGCGQWGGDASNLTGVGVGLVGRYDGDNNYDECF